MLKIIFSLFIIQNKMRIKLSEKYQSERENICNKLLEIIDLDELGYFLLCELDENKEKIDKIMALKDEIQKYFAVSSISSYRPNVTDTKRPYWNIVRGVLKQQDYIFEGNDINVKLTEKTFKRTMKYKIIKKD